MLSEIVKYLTFGVFPSIMNKSKINAETLPTVRDRMLLVFFIFKIKENKHKKKAIKRGTNIINVFLMPAFSNSSENITVG